MKKILGIVLASCALSSTIGAVHEMRTPLTLLSKLDLTNGSFHYPLYKVDPVLCQKTNVNFWAGAYYRSAFDGYCPKKCECCCSLPEYCEQTGCGYNICSGTCGSCGCGNSSSCGSCCNNNGICLSNTNYIGCTSCPENKVPLATLIFGKAAFGGQEAFNTVADIPAGYNYLLTATTTMSPKLDYKENGVVIGMHIERQVTDKPWRFGFNAALPIKSIELTRHFECSISNGQNYMFVDYPEAFFNSRGVMLCDSFQFVGLGDLDTALWFGYDPTERSYIEVVGGIRFPTGKKNTCPGNVYFIPAGNNGHFEAKIGVDAGWRSQKWIGIRGDVSYSHVLQAVEKKATQFKCATIRGIGPCIDAKVKYGYFLGHLDLTVFHPVNQDMGATLGYECYYKRQDCASFCPCNGADRMQDFFGNIEPINPAVMVKNTDILAHKIRGLVFNRWDFFELYAGASKVVGGFNGMAENELFMGFDINF